LLRELGITIPVGAGRVAPRVRLLIADASPLLPVAVRPSLESAAAEIVDLEKKILAVEAQLRALALQTPVATELQTIPGVGLLTSTALFAFVGSVDRFPSGRHFASYLGITPREHSSGSRRHLGSISKRGDAYLRTLLIHGARSILCRAKKTPHPNHLQTWALRVERKRGHNRAAVALANKLARIAWAVWKTGSSFTDEQYPRVAPL
jgi:transposase